MMELMRAARDEVTGFKRNVLVEVQPGQDLVLQAAKASDQNWCRNT